MALSNGVDSQKKRDYSAERELLTHALRTGWADGDGETGHRQTIRQLCTVAGDCPHSREQLLVAFRSLIISAADTAEIPFGPERIALLGHLATIFVEEFYSIGPANGADRDRNQRSVA